MELRPAANGVDLTSPRTDESARFTTRKNFQDVRSATNWDPFVLINGDFESTASQPLRKDVQDMQPGWSMYGGGGGPTLIYDGALNLSHTFPIRTHNAQYIPDGASSLSFGIVGSQPGSLIVKIDNTPIGTPTFDPGGFNVLLKIPEIYRGAVHQISFILKDSDAASIDNIIFVGDQNIKPQAAKSTRTVNWFGNSVFAPVLATSASGPFRAGMEQIDPTGNAKRTGSISFLPTSPMPLIGQLVVTDIDFARDLSGRIGDDQLSYQGHRRRW